MATSDRDDNRNRRVRGPWGISAGATALLAVGVLVGAPPASAKACDGVGVPCAIGDTGPGGGIVFYDAGSPQSWGRYLEAAPDGWESGAVRSVVPGAPRRVRVVVRQGGATVSWQAPAGSTGSIRYEVSTEPTSKGCRTAKRSCSISGLVPGRQYAFTVVAVGDAGEGDTAKAVLARVPARPQPAPSQKPVPVYRSGRAVMPLASSDPSVRWCLPGRPGYGAVLPTGTAIGTGRANTGIIVQACGRDSAAGRAAAYRGGVKDDWFLPSKDELDALYRQRAVFGALADGSFFFWSSTQSSAYAGAAWYQNFGNGGQDDYLKGAFRVRPVRAF